MKYKNIINNDSIKIGDILRFKNILLKAKSLGTLACSRDCFFHNKPECKQICCSDVDDNNIYFKEISEIEVLILNDKE